ncbi:hypothetical protein PMIN05_008897 [Paraphaeosphaeria minitans]
MRKKSVLRPYFNDIMSAMVENIRDYAQSNPLQVAAGLIIALPGTYLYISGKFLCATRLCTNATMSTQSLLESITSSLSAYETSSQKKNLLLPISRWGDKLATKFVVQVFRGARNNAIVVLTTTGEGLGLDVQKILRTVEERWVPCFPLSRVVSVGTTTALPGVFLTFIRKYPNSRAARHQTRIASALHVCALMTVANQQLSIQDLLVVALVVVSFEALQQVTHESERRPAVETRLQAHIVDHSTFSGSSRPVNFTRKYSSLNPEALSLSSASKEAEIGRMNEPLAEVRKSEKASDMDLKHTKAELNNVRATLNETFAEYALMRDELKTMKQALGRGHQAEVYRKDIELFALRKANEQKENYIKDRDGRLDDSHRQHKAALELKDAELRNLKDRILFLERQNSPRFDDDNIDSAPKSDSQAALQVKFLRIKGRNSAEIDERTPDEKDDEIAKLKADLTDAVAASKTLDNTQIELRRAWDATSEVQQSLNNERKQHAHTQEMLREAALKIEEELSKQAQRPLLNHRLSTIEEQNAQELEAMFNAAQQDNFRLYGEVEALEKRVREANARVFMAEQGAEALREQLRLEKAINDDMETARPSLVHRVHFQRMEGQLKESREQLEDKDKEITKLHRLVLEQDAKFTELTKANEASSSVRTALQGENERLKQSTKELESTKQQLMLDHERLTRHRARNRVTSTENTSARSSGATLITEPLAVPPIPPIPTDDEDLLLPARPVSIARSSSIQGTPERLLRREPTPNRLSMISADVPPDELRHSHRKPLTLKGFLRKIARKDDDEAKTSDVPSPAVTSPRPKTALLPKDRSAMVRPKTAAPETEGDRKGMDVEKEKDREGGRPNTAAPSKERIGDRRFLSGGRPKTAVTGIRKGEGRAEEHAGERPKSRGWGASRKLVRRSIAP